MSGRNVRLTDAKLIERIEAYMKAASEPDGLRVSFAQAVHVILRKGFASIDAQPRKGVR